MTLAERAAALDWYHSIDLGAGVVTPGWFDTRGNAQRVPLPARLDGLRCLDVGTWDGFWAFEMERRGAAEVVAVDIDDPDAWDWPQRERLQPERLGLKVLDAVKNQGAAFRLAHEALGSKVERRDLSVYRLDPEEIGRFDVVFLGSLLLHLRDPVLALERLRSVCRGTAVIADTIELLPSLLQPRKPVARLEGVDRPWWWQPNRAGLLRMLRSAGWEIQEATGVYYLPTGPAHPQPSVSLEMAKAAFSAHGRERLVVRFVGVPHVAARVRPG